MSAAPRPVVEADLHAFADGYIAAERRSLVSAYLDTRPDEARRVADWRAQNDALRRALATNLAEPLAVPSLAEPLRLRSAPQEPIKASPPPDRPAPGVGTRGAPRRRNTRSLAPTSVIGAAILLGMAIGWLGAHALDSGRLLPPPASPLPQAAATDPGLTFAARAIEAHDAFLDRLAAVEVPARERGRLTQWLAKRIDGAAAAPDLSGSGFTLFGGRLIATNVGPTVLLMFENPAGERLDLLLARTQESIDSTLRYVDARGTGAVVWVDGTTALALAGPADPARLTGLAERVDASVRGAPQP